MIEVMLSIVGQLIPSENPRFRYESESSSRLSYIDLFTMSRAEHC